MSGQWPRWATVRAEEVRTVLPSEEWGAWAQGGDCSRGTPAVWGLPDTGHPSEPPFFFHCLSCIAAVHRGAPPPKPGERRDKGLCIRCGEPAEHLRDRRFTPSAACQQAEAKGITVARLSTRKWCAACDPHSLPFCQSSRCPDRGKRHRAIVCSHTTWVDRGGGMKYRPHCAAFCAAAREREAKSKGRQSRPSAPPSAHRAKSKGCQSRPSAAPSAHRYQGIEKRCQWCGEVFTAYRPNAAYCSKVHGKAARAAAKKMEAAP